MVRRKLVAVLIALVVAAIPAAAPAQIVNGRAVSNGQVTCTTTPGQALPPNTQRTMLVLYNADTTAANVIYIGSNNGPVGGPQAEVSSSNGFALIAQVTTAQQSNLTLPAYTGDIRCVSGAGSPKLHYLEFSR